jgi:hypothetical protein
MTKAPTKKSSAPPPPWGDEGPLEWVKNRLVQLLGPPEAKSPRTHFYVGPDAEEVEAAEGGDIAPLMRKYPHLARYLRAPDKKGGQTFLQFDPRLKTADAERPKIRAFLQQHYQLLSGKKITLDKVLAARRDVNENLVGTNAASKRKQHPRDFMSEYLERAELAAFDPDDPMTIAHMVEKRKKKK